MMSCVSYRSRMTSKCAKQHQQQQKQGSAIKYVTTVIITSGGFFFVTIKTLGHWIHQFYKIEQQKIVYGDIIYGNEMIKKIQMKRRWKLLFLEKFLSLTKLTSFTVSSSISGFTIASVTSGKILTQGTVLTQRCSTLVYICVQNKKPDKKPLIFR